ncbi:sulfonate dioxygenase [Apiospora sp. TS-2023a]
MPHVVESLRVVPLRAEVRKTSQIGAEVILPPSMKHLDFGGLSDDEKATLRSGLFDNGVLVVRNQQGLDPNVMPQIGRFFDETAWHMDAPLYERLPGFVTSLHSLKNPALPDQKLQFPSGEVMPISAGATAFYSGARAFELLSAEEKEFALNTTVQYAPRAYEWILNCKATDDGMTIARSGQEKKLEDLPEWSWDKVHAFPRLGKTRNSADNFHFAQMVWRNHGNGKPHLQVLGCCVYALHTTDPATGEVTVTDDLDEVRGICHKLTREVYTPENIYAHRWQEGDLVIFHNRGVLHSITGELSRPSGDSDPEKRLFWQCTMASGTAPVAYQAAG